MLAVLLLWGSGLSWTVAREVPVTILHTTDLHGHIDPGYVYDGRENVGGLLRCAGLIESIRRETPNVLLVDCGDTIQGGLESWLTRGRIVIDALAWLKYDAWVIGNHEFDWGLDALRPLHDQARVPMLGANIGVLPGRTHPLPRVKPYVIRNIDGIRVALVGLTTPGIPRWTRPERLGDLQFLPSGPTLEGLLPILKAEKPDLMILLLHQGYHPGGDNFSNEVSTLAGMAPEFDVIIGGHSHQLQPNLEVNGVLYTQAGYHGNWLGRVDLVYDTVRRELSSREARLIETGSEVPPSPAMEMEFKDELDAARKRAREIVGHTSMPLRSSSNVPGSSSQQQLIARAVSAGVDVGIVLHGAFGNYPLEPGPITDHDLWRMIPYENLIVTVMLTPAELKDILEENVGHLGSFAFQGVYGIRYTLQRDGRPGEQIVDLCQADGRPFHPRKRYKVAMNSYAAASGGNRYNRLRSIIEQPEARMTWSREETREMVRRYLKAHDPLDFKVVHAVTPVGPVE